MELLKHLQAAHFYCLILIVYVIGIRLILLSLSLVKLGLFVLPGKQMC
jgi:hypothetical protein